MAPEPEKKGKLSPVRDNPSLNGPTLTSKEAARRCELPGRKMKIMLGVLACVYLMTTNFAGSTGFGAGMVEPLLLCQAQVEPFSPSGPTLGNEVTRPSKNQKI
jgi:hypothetical protein